MPTLIRSLPVLLALSCADKGDDTSGAYDPASFSGGSYQFTSVAVSDGCLDGAMTVLFLPEGDGTTKDWQYPIELPAWSDLPSTYNVQLQDPFSTMPITVTAGGSAGTLVVSGAEQTGVEWNADGYPGCMVDMNINVDVTIDSDSEVHGTATMSTAGFLANTDLCPPADADPCDVVLDFTGALQ